MRSQTRPWSGTSKGLWRSDLPHQDLTTWDHRPDRDQGRLKVSEEVTYLIRIWPHEITDQTMIRDVYRSLKKWLTSSESDHMRSQTRPWSGTSKGLWRSDLPHQDLTTWDHRPDRDQGRLKVSAEVTYLIRIWPHEITDQTVIRDVYRSLKTPSYHHLRHQLIRIWPHEITDQTVIRDV